MAYTINKTDGSILTSVPDGQVDDLSTNITFIGKNYSGFGEILNENLVKMLENFAGVSRPRNPLRGELWFDTAENRLKVYNGIDFATVGSATISSQQPTTLNPGDLWYSDVDQQLYFFDGQNTILIGPLYSRLQGLSGFRVENVIDILNQNRTIVSLYVGNTLVGIFSKDTFTPKTAITGFAGSIVPGFNAGSLAGIKLNATATNSEQLAGKAAELYVTKDQDTEIVGTLSLSKDLGLAIGSTPGNGQLYIDGGNLILANTAQNRDFRLQVRRGILSEDAIAVTTATRNFDIYPGRIDSTARVGGSLVVDGNLTVNGTTTSVNTSTLEIEDKNIELAKSSNPTDINANGGGLTLKGTTDKQLYWVYDNAGDVNDPTDPQVVQGQEANAAWNSTEHINLIGKSFKINGVEVLSGTSLGTGITSAPGITSFGTQSVLDVDDINLDDNIISITAFNRDLVLTPNGNGTVNVSNKRISNLAEPTGIQDATTKNYVDFTVRGMPLIFGLDITRVNPDGTTTTLLKADLENYLNLVAPVGQFRIGTEARIICSTSRSRETTINLNDPANPFVQKNFVTAQLSPSGTANVVQDFAVSNIVIPLGGIPITVTRELQLWRVVQDAGTTKWDRISTQAI
jgi:hypothetical protein